MVSLSSTSKPHKDTVQGPDFPKVRNHIYKVRLSILVNNVEIIFLGLWTRNVKETRCVQFIVCGV